MPPNEMNVESLAEFSHNVNHVSQIQLEKRKKKVKKLQ